MYRFRALDASNARFFTLKFWVLETTTQKLHYQLPFDIIGSDQGYLNSPVTLKSYRMGPGERAQILVDFSSLPIGTTVLLRNHAAAPFPSGDNADSDSGKVMKFIVNKARREDAMMVEIPSVLNNIPPADSSKAINAGLGRLITLTEKESPTSGNPVHSYIDGLPWEAATTILPRAGTTEIWTIINFTTDMHPMHIHLVPHRVLSRQKFNSDAFDKKQCSFVDGSCLTGEVMVPEAYERGWKDTTQASPGYVTKLLLDFRKSDGKSFSFDPTKGPGM